MTANWIGRIDQTLPPISSQTLQLLLLTIVSMLQTIEQKMKDSDEYPLLDPLIYYLRHAPHEEPYVSDDLKLVADYLENNRDFSLLDFFGDSSVPPVRIN